MGGDYPVSEENNFFRSFKWRLRLVIARGNGFSVEEARIEAVEDTGRPVEGGAGDGEALVGAQAESYRTGGNVNGSGQILQQLNDAEEARQLATLVKEPRGLAGSKG